MIGNRVKAILAGDRYSEIRGVLHKLDAAGAMIYRESPIPEGCGTVFIPSHRIVEIIDYGRAP